MRPVPLSWLTAACLLWAGGALIHEALATAGALLTLVLALRHGWPAQLRAGLRADAALLAGLAWGLLAPLVTALPTGSGLARWLDWLLVLPAAWALAALDEPGRRRVATGVAVILLGSCALAWLQHLGAWPRPEAFAGLAWTKLPFHRVYELVPGRDDRFMGAGLLLHRLKFANTGALAVVGLAGLATQAGPRRGLWIAAAGVGFFTVAVVPHARAAAVAMALGVAVALVLASPTRRRAVWAVGGVAAACVLALVAVPSAGARLLRAVSGDEQGERQVLLSAGGRAVAAHPLAGVGLGRFRPVDFAPPDAPESVRGHQGKTHDQWLTIAAEAGLPAAVALVAWTLQLAWAAWRRRRAGPWVAVVLVFGLLTLLHDPLFHAETSLGCMLALGGVLAFARAHENDARSALG